MAYFRLCGITIRVSMRFGHRTERRILDYAAKHRSGKFTQIDVGMCAVSDSFAYGA
jgi:hypothetical protein